MKARNDGYLYSGMSQRVAEQKEEKRDEKASKRGQILPSAELAMQLIANEKSNIMNIESFVLGLDTPEEDVKAHLLARKLYFGYLTELNVKFQNLMRVPKTKKVEVEEDEDE